MPEASSAIGGSKTGGSLGARVGLGIGVSLLAAVAVSDRVRLLLQLALIFGSAVAGPAATVRRALASIFALVVVIDAVLMSVWEHERPRPWPPRAQGGRPRA